MPKFACPKEIKFGLFANNSYMKKKINIYEAIAAFHTWDEADPLGSYTGHSLFDEVPEQDADDL